MRQLIRVFMVDGTQVDLHMTLPWEAIIHQLITNDCIIASNIFIDRQSVLRVIAFNEGVTEIGPPADILDFPTPKGTA